MEKDATPPEFLEKNKMQSPKQLCTEFINSHHNVLDTVESHLKNMIAKTEPDYAKAYKPWLKGLQDLCIGVYLISKGIPLPNKQNFLDALNMFTFESALQLLNDICESCKLNLKNDWLKKFREDIDNILFVVAKQQQSQSHSR